MPLFTATKMAIGVSEVTTIFIDNKYTRWYYDIIGARLTKPVAEGVYTESHHIIPESFYIERTREGPSGWLDGDSEVADNKVSLTAREHFICHWLLTKMTEGPARVKMMDAIMGMRAENKNQRRYKTKITSRVYARLKKEYSLISSERMMGENNPQWGRVWTDEEKEAQADKVRGDKNGSKSESARQAMRELKTGVKRAQFSQEWLDKLAATRQGESNGMYGKEHREESKALQSQMAERYGWVTDGTTNERVLKADINDWLQKGWTVGRTLKPTGERPKTECPHCGTLCAANTYARFHGDKCKHKA